MDFVRFPGVLRSFMEFHGISQNPVEFAEIPEFRAGPEILKILGPNHTTRLFEIKHRNPTKFHEIPRSSSRVGSSVSD